MKLINTQLLTPGNILIIGLISLGVHLLTCPIYKMIDKGNGATDPTTGN